MVRDVFGDGGVVGADLSAVDWAATPLGPPRTWPASLVTVVRTLLSSRFSMWMAWGPRLTFFCNDAYRRTTLGKKYPWALGRPAREVWAEIWPDIGPRIETVISTGTATWDEALLLFLERSGYVEETYHTFSYSPLVDDAGAVAGMLCVVSEDTDRVIGERRMATLRDLGSEPTATRTEAQLLAAVGRQLESNRRDLPFALVYRYQDGDATARLVAAMGAGAGEPAAPTRIDLRRAEQPWPAAQLADGELAVVDDLPARFAALPTGAWAQPPTAALVVPLAPWGAAQPYGFLVAALNRYRPLDDGYRGFVDLVARQVAAGIAAASAYETQRRRAESLAELDRAKTAFFTNISHEVRTPLTLLLAPAEDALADGAHPLAGRQRERVEVIHRNAQRLLKLVNTLLDFSSLESGIGLALVAELARLHGGDVAVASVPGRGSRFTVRVPLGSAHLPAQDVVSPADRTDPRRQAAGFLAEATRWLTTGPEAGTGPQGRPDRAVGEDRADRPLVLVVDDNADMRDHVVSLLADEYRVETARNGEAALEQARLRPPDLVLTDVMMPHRDGFELLAALHADPVTAHVPVVMLSARAGGEATADGLEAGADDYLTKPFTARELLARVRANLELDRARRTSSQLRHSRALLDQAQRLARVGSWELDLATGAVTGSLEYLRLVQLDADELGSPGGVQLLLPRLHPDDAARFEAIYPQIAEGQPLDQEVRLVAPDGAVRWFHAIGEAERDADGVPVLLRGSLQDVTEHRRAEQAVAAAAAEREAAAREHRIADELQRSLLPASGMAPEQLDIAGYYRAGVLGTQVGGDWYDLIPLGADRTALVMGDVMGRGVRAAAVMGQLRAATRAYARLDLPPADLLEFLDGVVRDLGDDQIVTCVYAVYDPADHSLTYANAGHLPPLLVLPGALARPLPGTAGPPLGAGPITLAEQRVVLPAGALLALYTDGLVEHRDRDLDAGIDALADLLTGLGGSLERAPEALVEALLPAGPDDDIAVLLARVAYDPQRTMSATMHIPARQSAVQQARAFVARTLRGWGVPHRASHDVVLLGSELVTNAVVHGRPPIELRLRRTGDHLVLEVDDSATFLPRKLRPTPEDEHGRGLQLVSLLAERWGTRPTVRGKSMWCVYPVTGSGTAG